MGAGKRCARRMQGKIGSHLAGGRYMAFADASALHNPVVGGRYRTRQLVIAENSRGKIAAAAEHDRTQLGHEAAPLATLSASCAAAVTNRSRAMDWPILASNS